LAQCFKDGDKPTADEEVQRGGKSSMIHVDWMIGSGSMKIDGFDAQGNITPVFINGK
jgi:aminopeptidase